MKRSNCARPRMRAAEAGGKTALPVVLGMAIVATAFCGCGTRSGRTETQPVEGQVLWKGRPLEGAQVVFCPQGEATAGVRAPRACTGSDGRFHLGTYGQADGAPEGQYVVTVVDFPLVRFGDEAATGPNILPRKYASPNTSDLRAHVAKGSNALPALDLK